MTNLIKQASSLESEKFDERIKGDMLFKLVLEIKHYVSVTKRVTSSSTSKIVKQNNKLFDLQPQKEQSFQHESDEDWF